jgi:uncharacterized membrane protein
MNDIGSEERNRNHAWKRGFSPQGDFAASMPERGRPGVRRKAIIRSERTAHGLGWFSIGLGLAEILAPRGLGRAIGVGYGPGKGSLFRAYGLREIAAGLGILSRRRPAAWVWARVAGDVIDLASLTAALVTRRRGQDRARIAGAIGAVLGVTAVDYLTARHLGKHQVRRLTPDVARSAEVTKTLTIGLPAEEVYRFWRNFENLPRFMAHLESVVVHGDRRSRWTAKGPGGKTFSWEAEITQDRPNELISWRSTAGADVPNTGTVRFLPAPGGRGTELRVDLKYDPPAGLFGASVAKLFGKEPGEQIEGDLRRFKQVMETGEVLNSDASIHRGMHAAQPPQEVPARVLARLHDVKGGGR